MDATKAAKAFEYAQRDEAASGTQEGAINAAIESRLRELHTVLPGIIRSFDAVTQTATVQPAIRRIFVSQGAVDLPELVDCPVCFPGGGGFFLTFPVTAGDECLIHFSERAIDHWFEFGGVQDPSEARFHDLSDAFVTVGVTSQPSKLASCGTSGVELRSRDGTTKIKIAGTKVTVEAATVDICGTSEPAVLGDALKTLYNAHVHVCAAPGSPSAVPTVPMSAAQLSAKVKIG